MITMLCLFAPAVLATAYYFHLWKWTLRGFQFAVFSIIFAFLINSFLIGVTYLRGKGAMAPDYFFATVAGTIKFCALALVVALVLPHILYVVGCFKWKPSQLLDQSKKTAEEKV